MIGWNNAAFGAFPSIKDMPEEYQDRLSDLMSAWTEVRARNEQLSAYYDMKTMVKDLGISIPENMFKVNCVVGWCKKAVDAAAVRTVFDGYAVAGEENERLSELVRQNRMRGMVKQAIRSSMTHGVSFLSAMAGQKGQPEVKVRAFSANQGAVLWDKDEGRIGCGLLLHDVDSDGNPTRYVAHFPEAVLEITRDDDGKWTFTEEENPLGRPMLEALIYDPDLDRPLGHSLLTPEITGIVDKAMRDVLRMEVGSEFFTYPQRYILGAAEDLFPTISTSEATEGAEDADEATGSIVGASNDMAHFQAYVGALLAISKDSDGDIPQVGQFSPSSAENFTVMFENDAQRFSGATNVPLAQLGVMSNNYTSSDALNAANDPLILSVEEMERSYGEALSGLAELMCAICGEKPESDIQTVWKNPAMPTISARADAWTKFGAQDESIVGTDTYYEGMGLSQQQIDRLKREKNAKSVIDTLNEIREGVSNLTPKVAQNMAYVEAKAVEE